MVRKIAKLSERDKERSDLFDIVYPRITEHGKALNEVFDTSYHKVIEYIPTKIIEPEATRRDNIKLCSSLARQEGIARNLALIFADNELEKYHYGTCLFETQKHGYYYTIDKILSTVAKLLNTSKDNIVFNFDVREPTLTFTKEISDKLPENFFRNSKGFGIVAPDTLIWKSVKHAKSHIKKLGYRIGIMKDSDGNDI